MKQIYNFEQHNPPVLNENMLRSKIERRNLQWQTILLALAGILLQVAIALFGYSAIDWYPWLTIVCCIYIVASVIGGSIIAITHSRKGGITT